MGNTPSIVASKVQTSRQPAQRPQNSRPIFEGVSETVDTIGPHDRASFLTVTPPPKDADIVVRTPGTAKTYSGQTAGFLSPSQILETEGVEDAKGLSHRGQVKCTITGIEPTSALAWAIRSHIGEKDVHMEPVDENSIKLRARMDSWKFSRKVRNVCQTINDLWSMGVDDDSVVAILHRKLYDSEKRIYGNDIIIQFVEMGHHSLAKHCLSGYRRLDSTLIGILRRRLSDRNVDLSALAAGQDRNEGLRELIALFCLDLCTKEKPDPLQAACLVRDYLETYSEPLPYQEMVMSGLLDAIRTPDDAVRLKDRLWLERFRSELTDQWLKRLEARAYPETMLDGQHCDPVTLTIAGALERATYIKGALWRGHCALAYELICDFAAALDQCPVLHNFPDLAELCAQRNLRTFNTRLYEAGKGSDDSAYFQGQKGKMMLCEFLARGKEASTIEDHHVDYFKQLGRCMSGLDGEVISRELLDVPEPDRAELLRNPKTRHLLRLTGYPAIVAEIVGDEQKANDRIMNSLKQLQAEGFIFSDFAGEKPINIFRPGSPSHQSINLLLELAEAAVLTTSLGNWAAGVVQYLSTQLLTPDQVKKAIALCDDIRSTVQFSPDPTLSTTLDAVKALTDAAKFENNAEAVFLDRLQKLKDAGIVFSGDPLTTKETESIEVEGGVFGEETVDMLLDLAEAAVKSQGWTNWAIGVLSFLSDRVLADDQMNRAVSIRRRIR